MSPDRLPVIAAGSGTDAPMRFDTAPYVHVSDLTAEEVADWTECDDAPEIGRPDAVGDAVYADDHGR